jgi:hypothetical protein
MNGEHTLFFTIVTSHSQSECNNRKMNFKCPVTECKRTAQ